MKCMVSRSFGWVQNPSDFNSLKKTVQIFDYKSKHYFDLKDNLIREYIPDLELKEKLLNKLNSEIVTFSYNELVGSSVDINGNNTDKRKNAVANSLIQISVKSQKSSTNSKHWTDNWTSDGFLRWAVSLNFVKHNRDTDLFTITELGLQFSNTLSNSEEEKKILKTAFLSYPPATRVLDILNKNLDGMTKFEIGSNLGFIGEKGFTSYNNDLMNSWLENETNPEVRKSIRQDIEGTSDKYARMICTWLIKVGFVEKIQQKIISNGISYNSFLKYRITAVGIHALRQINGSSKNKKQTKFIKWEFLATNVKNRDYIRTRRAYILKIIEHTKSIDVLMKELSKYGFNDDFVIIMNDIAGLNNIGINIEKSDNTIHLKDKLNNFSIPSDYITNSLKDSKLENMKLYFMKNTNIDHKYIELLEIAYDGKRNKDFEILTAELFKEYYKLNTIQLGSVRRPDSIAYSDSFGIIIDTKAYKDGYSKNISEEDKMVRYIEDFQKDDLTRNSNEWWRHFPVNIDSSNIYYLWVSSYYNNGFISQLKQTFYRTKMKGGAIEIEELLLGAEAVQNGNLNVNDIPNYFENNIIKWDI